MDTASYQYLCKQVSATLQIDDDEALGAGQTVDINAVEVEMRHCEGAPIELVLFFEVGMPQPERRLQAYEALLALQLLWVGEMNGMFVLDIAADRLMFTVSLSAVEFIDSQTLADVLSGFTQQVGEWRTTILSGLLLDGDNNNVAVNGSAIVV